MGVEPSVAKPVVSMLRCGKWMHIRRVTWIPHLPNHWRRIVRRRTPRHHLPALPDLPNLPDLRGQGVAFAMATRVAKLILLPPGHAETGVNARRRKMGAMACPGWGRRGANNRLDHRFDHRCDHQSEHQLNRSKTKISVKLLPSPELCRAIRWQSQKENQNMATTHRMSWPKSCMLLPATFLRTLGRRNGRRNNATAKAQLKMTRYTFVRIATLSLRRVMTSKSIYLRCVSKTLHKGCSDAIERFKNSGINRRLIEVHSFKTLRP